MVNEKLAAEYASAINATWLRRHATLAAIAVLKRLRRRLSSVLFLTPSKCVKYGKFQHLSEAAAMQYIAAHTNIPVPKIYCAFERKGVTYIVMSRIGGSMIGQNWEQRSEDSKKRLLLLQLKGFIDEMRSLRPVEEGRVQAVDGGKLYDPRLSGGVHGFGPFESVHDFHSFLRDGIDSSPGQIPEVNELVERHRTLQYDVRLTHGDLSSMNILCEGDDIVGIVDWETAGWYPEYWEYTTASNVIPSTSFGSMRYLDFWMSTRMRLIWNEFDNNTSEHFERDACFLQTFPCPTEYTNFAYLNDVPPYSLTSITELLYDYLLYF